MDVRASFIEFANANLCNIYLLKMDDKNVEEFINKIVIRPVIWNSKSDEHSNCTETKYAWEGICEKCIEDFKKQTTINYLS